MGAMASFQYIMGDTWATHMKAWKSNHMRSKRLDEIICPFLNFSGCTVEIWECISNFIPQFTMDVFIHAEIKVNPYL